MKLIIFGGAFDPIHIGHLNMAEEAHKQLGADVFFVLAPISVWKETSAPIEDKINMINLSIKDKSYFHLDLFEINSGKNTNYSIDTVKHFKNKYPEAELYYLIGTDQVNKYHLWKECDELSKLAKIVYFKRPDITVDNANIERFNIFALESDKQYKTNSTDIRGLKSFEVVDEVKEYIVTNVLYDVEKVKSMLTEERFIHSINVAKLAYEIAKINHLEDADKVFLAGLLHDIGKNESKSKEIMNEHYSEFLDIPAFAHHQFVGEYLAKTIFGIEDTKILKAIKFHTTGNDEMSDIAKIIYAVDKIEPGRKYDSSDLIKAMKENSIDEGFKIVLKANKDFLESKGKMVGDRLTFKCFDRYL